MRLLAVCFLFLPVLAFGRELTDIHAVYFFPMSHALDQYIANRITSDHVFRVVSDPKLADAVFTDRLGEDFESRLKRAIAPDPEETESEDSDKDSSKTSGDSISSNSNVAKNKNLPPMSSTFTRGKGTLFLVDAKSKQVLWSDFEPPRSTSSKQMDRTARRIVTHLRKNVNDAGK